MLLGATNVEEIIATFNTARRTALLATCRQLLTAGDCILSFQVIVSKQIKAFHSRSVGVGWPTIVLLNLVIF